MLITQAKKHYASKVELQEGNIIPEESSLDVKGMEAFVKSSMNANTQAKLKQILYNDILDAEVIDQIGVLKDIAIVEKEIFNSIMAGEKKYYKPAKIKSLSAYEQPMRIQGIMASYAYNALHQAGTDSIDLDSRNSIDIIKVDMNKKNIEQIKDDFPDVYDRALKLFEVKEFADGVSAIAIPLNEQVPGWVLPFVRCAEIINDNVAKFPLESIGLFRGSANNNSANIISF